MGWARYTWIWIIVGMLAIWWFFTGDNPVNLLNTVSGRGRRLTLITLDSQGNAHETLDDLVDAASKILGRPVRRDALALAILSGSEHAGGSQKEKAAIQRVALNRVTYAKDLVEVLTSGKGLGKQGPRQFATSRDAYEDDLDIAEVNLAGLIPDDTHGAKFFVHWSGFSATSGSYAATCASWYQKYGIVPINIGGVSSLRLFVPEATAKELGYA